MMIIILYLNIDNDNHIIIIIDTLYNDIDIDQSTMK